jgi:hypothetical protein
MIKKQANTLYFGASLLKEMAATVGMKTSKLLLDKALPQGIETLAKGHKVKLLRRRKAKTAKGRAAASADNPLTIGVWDVDVHAGFLYRVLEQVNRSQKIFRFHPIEATVPVGLTVSGERTRAIARSHNLKPSDKDLANNALASDIYGAAEPLREKLGIDLLVVLISPMIMVLEATSGEHWNLFSTSKDRVVIASAYDLREYARKAKRSFEACLATILAAAVVQEVYDTVESHDETVGCVFDFCDDRDDIVKGLKTINVCKASLEQVPETARASVKKMFDAIREYAP